MRVLTAFWLGHLKAKAGRAKDRALRAVARAERYAAWRRKRFPEDYPSLPQWDRAATDALR